MNYRLVALVLLGLALSTNAFSNTLKKLEKTKWYEVKTSNFHVVTDAKPKIATALVRDLENFRYFLTRVENRPILEGVDPVKILAIRKTSSFKALDMPDNIAGVFSKNLDGSKSISNIKGYKGKSDSFSFGRHTLMHEYTHYAMSNMFDPVSIPLWYSEGMADYYGSFEYDNDTINMDAFHILKNRIWILTRRDGSIPKIDIEALFTRKSYPKKLEKFYGRSLIVFHYMYADRVRRKQLGDYIAYLNQGFSDEESVRKAFNLSYDELSDEVDDYIHGRGLNGWQFKAGENGFDFPDKKLEAEIITNEALTEFLVDVISSFGLVDDKTKQEIISTAYSKYPKNVSIALANIRHSDVDEAKRKNDYLSLLEKHPDNSNVLALYGSALFDEAELYKDAGLELKNELIDEARKVFRKSISNHMFNARANYLLALTYEYDLSETHLKEGLAALDNSRFLVNWRSLGELEHKDAFLRMRIEDNKGAAKAILRYQQLSDSHWAHDYGQFMLDAWKISDITNLSVNKQDGLIQYSDGSIYKGEWFNNKPNGDGVLTTPNNMMLSGKWKDGKLQGAGEFKSTKGYHYVGNFKDSKITGDGVLAYPLNHKEFIKSEGEFFNAIENGKHVFYRKNGAVESGHMVSGYWHGLTKYQNKEGEIKESYYIRNNRRFKMDDGHYFVGGNWKDDSPYGHGICYREPENIPKRCELVKKEEEKKQ